MQTQNTKIFIVDDEALLVTMLSDYLKEMYPGSDIHTFPTGEACLEKLDEKPDVIILDYYLNSSKQDAGNGIDILKSIKEKNKTLPVIMLSSQERYSTAAQTIQHGAIHYVPKGPNAFQEISELIKANV